MYDSVVSIYVLKSLLERRETFWKKYGAAFWEIAKKYGFLTSKKKGISSRVFLNQNLQNLKLKSGFLSKKKVTSQNSKIAQIYFTWSLSVPSFKKIGEPHKKKYI